MYVCVKQSYFVENIHKDTYPARPGWRWEPCTINISITLKVVRRYATAQPSAPLVRQDSVAGDAQASLVLACFSTPFLVLLLPIFFSFSVCFSLFLGEQNTP